MRQKVRRTILTVMALCVLMASPWSLLQVSHAEEILLVGAIQGAEAHVYGKVLRKFTEEVKALVPDQPVRFEIYYNGERGLESDYFTGMFRGYTGKQRVDFAVIAPSHMANIAPAAAFMDTPFLFRDTDHWNRSLEAGVFAPIEKVIAEKADVMVLGYAGGGVRNIFAPKPMAKAADLNDRIIRVMSGPIQSKIFTAIGMKPRPMRFSQIYESFEKARIDAAENEAAGIADQKFYNIAPEVMLTRHSITVRPLCFSGKVYRELPEPLRQAILKAGKSAAEFGRRTESEQDDEMMRRMIEAGQVRPHEMADREALLQKTEAVKKEYAEELGVADVLQAINAL